MATAGRKVTFAVVVCLVIGIGAGILIGYFAIPQKLASDGGDTESCLLGTTSAHKGLLESYQNQCEEQVRRALGEKACDFDLPRHYVSYHLNNKSIVMDGRLDDEAWAEVPWSELFVDIRGTHYAKPRFDTKFKLRWDDERIYVGALLQETDIWANFTVDESPLYQENAFEVFATPDGSFHNYKEMEISVLNKTWDLMMTKAYVDGGERDDSWNSSQERAVYTDGTVNDPNNKGTFWSIEWSFTFNALAFNTTKVSKPTPDDGEVWFMIFARAEHPVEVVNGHYEMTGETDWWSWQPTGAVALHVPNRWGLVQFKKDLIDHSFSFPRWHVYRALLDVFEAEHNFHATFDQYTNSLEDLKLAPYLLTGACVNTPDISLNENDGFVVTIRSKQQDVDTGHIRADRKVWFG